MSGLRVKLAICVAAVGVVVVVSTVAVAGDRGKPRAFLTGYEEVPAVSTAAGGSFRAAIDRGGDELAYVLRYEQLEGDVLQAHIHFGQRSVNGGVTAFLCSNLGNGPAGTQACPAEHATVRGTITAADVVGGAADQGIDAGEFEELLRAMRAGVTYANVHSTEWPGGEIRGQIGDRRGDYDD